MSNSLTSHGQLSQQPIPQASSQQKQTSSLSQKLQEQAEQQRALVGVITRIRASLDLETLFTTTATEVRQLLQAERVGVFRFDPDSGWNKGEFVSEDVAIGFTSAIAIKVEDDCFGDQFAVHYEQGRVQAVADIYSTGLSPCHIQILETFEVRANLIVPLLQGRHLWGLLCIHQCSAPREWQLSEIEFVRQIADHLSMGLQHVEYVAQIQAQASQLAQAKEQVKALNRQKSLVKIANKIRQSFDFTTVCQTAATEVRHLLQVDRVILYRSNPDWSGELIVESVAEGWNPWSELTIENWHLMGTEGDAASSTLAVEDIAQAEHSNSHRVWLEALQARAYAIAPIFREDCLWGLLTAFQNSAPRSWEPDEIQLLAQIGEQIGIALQQSDYVQQVKEQSAKLEMLLQELKQSQMHLIHSEKMAGLGQLVAGVAHEINNPINFIYGNLKHVYAHVQDVLALVSLYQLHYPQPIAAIQEQAEGVDMAFILEDLPKTLASMKAGTDRIRQIVLSLRNFSRLDEAEFKTVDIHEGLDSTLLILGHRLKAAGGQQGIEVIKNYGDIPPVECYAAQVNQAFMHLLTNAIDAIEEALHQQKSDPDDSAQVPRIWIETQKTDSDQVRICIRDSGMGMSDVVKEQIFNHFFTTKTIGKGTGLGLTITQEIIVEKHGGSLKVDSTLEGGTEFAIHLPIKAQRKLI